MLCPTIIGFTSNMQGNVKEVKQRYMSKTLLLMMRVTPLKQWYSIDSRVGSDGICLHLFIVVILVRSWFVIPNLPINFEKLVGLFNNKSVSLQTHSKIRDAFQIKKTPLYLELVQLTFENQECNKLKWSPIS